MSSINTNLAAMAALQSLSMTQKEMLTTQSRVSTGLRVATAQDNAAYWSIATTMRSDNAALSTVKDALSLGAATADVAYTAINNTIKQLSDIGNKLVLAKTPGTDRKKIQADIDQMLKQIQSNADSASFSGQNWLKIDTTAGVNIDKSIVSSFSRDSANNISVGVITVRVFETASGDTIGLYDSNATAANKKGLMDKQFAFSGGGNFTIESIDISALTDSAADNTKLQEITNAVDATLLKMNKAATDLGSVKSRISLQKDFVTALMTAIDTGISGLVDADMNEESTRLQALQTKQSLGIQSLTIANQSSQSILKLFQ